ncbi:MAG: hypothetical protein AB3N07_02610 [Ruegeria sp.]
MPGTLYFRKLGDVVWLKLCIGTLELCNLAPNYEISKGNTE